jgi:hypothetical protein
VFWFPRIFVLDKKLQDGDKLPKLKANSWMGVYVGNSLAHSGNVPVIYSPQTTHDDQFTTVTGDSTKLTDQYFAHLTTSHHGFIKMSLQTWRISTCLKCIGLLSRQPLKCRNNQKPPQTASNDNML